jgi:hypothetical protein
VRFVAFDHANLRSLVTPQQRGDVRSWISIRGWTNLAHIASLNLGGEFAVNRLSGLRTHPEYPLKFSILNMTPPPSLSTIIIDRVSPAVALISYNRPKIANAFDVQHYLNTADALIWARDEPEVKVVIV